ncbi:MAG: adenosylcobinamide-GDP ribazoletransferase [Aliivibrio sp.]|uniref:adenosylcobinamide-GDP ribazoletransferase n=1 Tax=Aliivibrio sp. TaxID=1872443 RepID=UPI001A36A061|nr:adenosylcobinamide-GDP ribazoletransferase [Aliivibrio sp.]
MIVLLKKQLNLFYLALSFFTRIPIPINTPYSSRLLNQSGRYFSLIGLLVGAVAALSFYGSQRVFSDSVAIVISMIISLLLTGAFHEDGLADMADGIGGGMTADKRLLIMKDSRIGTYGAASLVLVLLFKFVLLSDLVFNLSFFCMSLLLAHGLSRAVAASLIFDMPYVSDIDTSKSKPLASRQSVLELLVLVTIGCVPLLYFSITLTLCLVPVLLLYRQLFKRWLMKRIGGFTGDCLGATQQISEIIIYLMILAVVQ